MNYSLLLSSAYLVGGVVILLFGFVILRENPRSPVNRATSLMLFSGALGTILGALGHLLQLQDTDATVSYAEYIRNFGYLWEFFFPSLLYFALVYPVAHPLVKRRQVLEIAVYIPHLFHFVLVLLLSEAGRFTRAFDVLLERIGPGGIGDFLSTVLDLVNVLVALMNTVHQQLFSLVNLAYGGVAVALLLRSRRRVVVPRLRGQLAIVVTGLVTCVAGYVAAMLLPLLMPYRDNAATVVFLVSVALIVASVTIAYAIVRHKFLDMQNLARRSILYGATAALFASIYLVVIRQVTRFGADVFGPNIEVIEAGFIVLSILIFQPLLTAVEDLIEQTLRRRDKTDTRTVIGQLGRELAAEVDLRGMRERLATTLERSLLVKQVQLVTLESPKGYPILDRGDAHTTLKAESSFERFLRLLVSSGQPVLRRDVERSLSDTEFDDLDELFEWIENHHLLVPLVQSDQVRGYIGVGPKLTGGRFHADDLALLSLLGQQMVTSIENVRLLSENVQKRILEEEIAMASEIQQRLLPTTFPENPGYVSYAISHASKLVGGDYFDVFVNQRNRLHLAIADVSGKGMAAALLMSSLRAALRSTVEHLESPSQVLARINMLLYESTSPEKFATFFYGVLDTERHKLVYSNAGHNYPILLHQDRSATELKEGGLLLGAFPDAVYQDGQIDMLPGETLFMYTDGITEATNGGDEDFGEQRLHELLRRWQRRELREIVEGVLDEVRTFMRGADPTDDVTMVIVRRHTRTDSFAGQRPFAGSGGVAPHG